QIPEALERERSWGAAAARCLGDVVLAPEQEPRAIRSVPGGLGPRGDRRTVLFHAARDHVGRREVHGDRPAARAHASGRGGAARDHVGWRGGGGGRRGGAAARRGGAPPRL